MAEVGKILLVVGGLLAVLGLLLMLGSRVPGLGRLPGDVVFRKGSVTVYFPIATSAVLSLLLTLLLSLFRR